MKKSIILIALALMFFGAIGAVGAFSAFNFATLAQYEEMVDSTKKVDSTEKVDSTKKTEDNKETDDKAGITSSNKVSDEELILATKRALDFRLRCIKGIFVCMCLVTAGCIIYAILTVLEQRVC